MSTYITKEYDLLVRQLIAPRRPVVREMQSRFPGKCAQCAQHFPAGETIVWDSAKRSASHKTCPTPVVGVPVGDSSRTDFHLTARDYRDEPVDTRPVSTIPAVTDERTWSETNSALRQFERERKKLNEYERSDVDIRIKATLNRLAEIAWAVKETGYWA